MAKKSKPAKKRGSKPRNTVAPDFAGTDTFEIEVAPPPAHLRGNNQEALIFFTKVERTVADLQVGQAFLIPSVQRASCRRYLKNNMPDKVFLINPVAGNDKVVRVYFLRYATSPKTKK